MAQLYAHVAQQPPVLQTAFIDGSEALRDFLGIGNPDKSGSGKEAHPYASSPVRIPSSEAPAALAMAATRSGQDTHVQRSLARLEEILQEPPSPPQAGQAYQQSVETALGTLLQALHKLPAEAAQLKAVDLIVQHLPQLHSDSREGMSASVHGAMKQQGIGNDLKKRLYDLMQTMQPKSTRRTGLEAVLRQRSLNSIQRNKAVSEPIAFRPIEPSTCSNYGSFNEVQVRCTDYARQAAELLIGEDGKLDGSRMAQMLEQLQSDEALPLEHKSHVIRTLTALQQNRELAETIDSICEEKALTGGAADVVRGTLTLPPDHLLSKADARKAVVMSLLGYLRQGNVGSCYATAPAICLLDSSPEVVAKDMKELLEENKLTFQRSSAIFEIPLNTHVQEIDAGAFIKVKEDGTTVAEDVTTGANGTAVRVLKDEAKLQDTFGMQAALTALGIPAEHQQAAIVEALQRMRRRGIDPLRNGVSFKLVINYLAGADLERKKEQALSAFKEERHVVMVNEDGIKEDGTKLENMPGMQAALVMLGIPVGRRQAYITKLLKSFPGGENKRIHLPILIHNLAIFISNENKEKVFKYPLPGINDVVRVAPDGTREDGSKLLDIRGIRDVLRTLSIPEAHRQTAINHALQHVFRSGIDPMKTGVSVKQIIDHLVAVNPEWMGRHALSAFDTRHNEVKVNEDGIKEDGARLQDTPGMQAALTALGIPEEQRQATIRDALNRMVQNNCMLDRGVKLQQIIEYLAYDVQSRAEVTKKEKSALRAFNGKQDVGLLRAWEYTLAGPPI